MYKNDLDKIFHEHTGNIIHKWDHYFEIYDRHFSRFRNKKVKILEIGVYKGGSLQMWQKYFGSDCEIYGVDINPQCKKFENEQIKIFIGSQEDLVFLKDLKRQIPQVDILIDDGGHMMKQLKTTFKELYQWVKEDGIYLAEDLHTCYWPEYNGGFRRKGSFIEYCKNLVDQLNAWHSQQTQLQVNDFTISTFSIHFYDSIVVFEKRKIEKPFTLYSGKIDTENIVSDPPKINFWKRFKILIYKHLGFDLG